MTQERRLRLRGFATLKQLVCIHMYMRNSTVIPFADRTKYSGTNMGDIIGPVKFEPWSTCWKLAPDKKKALYGEHRREVDMNRLRIIAHARLCWDAVGVSFAVDSMTRFCFLDLR